MTLLFGGKWLTSLPMSVRAGILLFDARERAGLTQIALATQAGVSHSIVQKVESGKAITSRTMGKILRVIGEKAE